MSSFLSHRRAGSDQSLPSSLPGISNLWRRDNTLKSPSTMRRLPSYRPVTPSLSNSRRPSAARLAIGILSRPFYVLLRRGPLYPTLLALSILIYFILSSPGDTLLEDDGTAALFDNMPIYNRNLNPSPLQDPSRTIKSRGRVGRLMQNLPGAARAADWAVGRWKEPETSPRAHREDIPDELVGQEDPLWVLPAHAETQHLPPLADLLQPIGKRTHKQIPLAKSHILSESRSDGRLLIIEGEEHPIPKLMARARRRWARLRARQSRTFKEAIAEYKRRYGRPPPKGFDRWYAFAKANNVKMIDEFDLIERDLHPFRAISPESFRARADYLSNVNKFDWTWAMQVRDGGIERIGQLSHHDRATDVENLCKRFVHELPDMTMWYSGHDNARIMVPWEEINRLNDLVDAGLYDDFEDADYQPMLVGPPPGWGNVQVCPPSSAVRKPGFVYGEATRSMTGKEMPQLPVDPKGRPVAGTIIESFKKYMDICESPQYRQFHSTVGWVYPHWPTGLLPLFSPGVHSKYNDIHSLIVEQFDLESQQDPTWEERPFDRLVWRGQTSGPQWDQYSPWISSHRSRLHLLSHEESGSRNICLALDSATASDRVRTVEAPNFRLNPLFLDTGMVGPAVQCIGETCGEMDKVYNNYDARLSFERSNLYKYVLDVDGNSWSGRFRRLMLSNAAVLKATVYTEFWTDWAIPWLHFIPVQVDYSDLWDIVAFFRGGLNGEGAHDALAKQIAVAGKLWAADYFRWADLEAYQFRLMLEYGRLWALDRSEMDYVESATDAQEPVWDTKDTFHKLRRRSNDDVADEGIQNA